MFLICFIVYPTLEHGMIDDLFSIIKYRLVYSYIEVTVFNNRGGIPQQLETIMNTADRVYS